MPDEGARTAAFAGFHGKLPVTGDFLSRGLPDAFRRNWDAWIARHVAPRLRERSCPDGGIRFRLRSGARVAGGAIVPGADSAGRSFPLSLVLVADSLPAPGALDPWCDAAVALAAEVVSRLGNADELWEGLDSLTIPGSGEDAPDDALVLWTRGGTAMPADPADPGDALDRLLAASPAAPPVSSG